MHKRIRAPFLFIAVILIVACVLIELGGTDAINATPLGDWLRTLQAATPSVDELLNDTGLFDDFDAQETTDSVTSELDAPRGFGVKYLALLDSVLALTLISTASGLVIPQAIQAQGQGCVSCFFAIGTCMGGIAMIFTALASLILMVALLLAVPFGTIVYFIKFADFDTAASLAVLGATMVFKILAVISLILAHQGFLLNLGLIVLFVSSFVGNIVVSFLLTLPPGFLVSITDAIAGILVALCAVIWAIPLFIGAVLSIIQILGFVRKAGTLPKP